MRATSGCHLAGLGNVRILACAQNQFLIIAAGSLIHVVHAMQSASTGLFERKALIIGRLRDQ